MRGIAFLCLLIAGMDAFTAPISFVTSPNDTAKRRFVSASPQLNVFPSEIFAPLISTSTQNAIPSALAAYGHYLGFGGVVAALVTERFTICKTDQTEKDFDIGSYADIAYGLTGTLILVSGYLRVTQYGKGWEFYSHEPVFWVKLFLFSVMGAASFFPTTKVIQRAVGKKVAEDKGEDPPPMWSPKLIARVTSIVNAELLAVASIPLFATLMARGVGYAEWLPWQLGAAPSVLAVGGLGYKYINEALTWTEEEQ